MTAPLRRVAVDPVAELRAEIAALAAESRETREAVGRIEILLARLTASGPREGDGADTRVVARVAEFVGQERSFSAAEVLVAADLDPELRDALETAGIDGAVSLGLLLKRFQRAGVLRRDGSRRWRLSGSSGDLVDPAKA